MDGRLIGLAFRTRPIIASAPAKFRQDAEQYNAVKNTDNVYGFVFEEKNMLIG